MTAAPAPAAPTLGPVLRFRGAGAGRLRLAVTVAGPAPEGVRPLGALGGLPFGGAELDLAVPPGADAVALPPGLRTALPELPAAVAVPGAEGALRLAFASCNGAEDEAALLRVPGGRDAMWRRLLARHAARPFHLLVLGGDQIYADAVWTLPRLAAWRALPRRRRLAAPWTEAMAAEAAGHYRDVYARAFGSPAVRAALAAIPSVMIWDDHDIVDGWGSRAEAWQRAPVPQGLFRTARRAFALLQLGIDPAAAPPASAGFAGTPGAGFGWSGTLGPARIVVPDLRSGRTRRRVMAAAAHAHLRGAAAGHGRAHTIVVSSVPLVNADLSAVERLVRPLMPVLDLFQDDLRDQWMSHAHRAEWRGVMDALLRAAAAGSRVTVLSGEIHLGARGTARRDGASVAQLIASGIAHPPPPGVLARLHERFARRPWDREGVALAMRPVLPDGRRYVAERNWLEVTAGAEGGLEAVLHAEASGAVALGEG